MGQSLTFHRRDDGSVTIAGEAPDEHVFSARWLARELGQIASVTIHLDTDDGVVDYELTGFGEIEGQTEDDGSPKLNFTALHATKVT